MEPEKHVPTITIKLLDAERFTVEVALDCPSIELVRAMLNEATEAIRKMIADKEAVEFGATMSAAQSAHQAMQKKPFLG